jgi:hypothetical protein
MAGRNFLYAQLTGVIGFWEAAPAILQRIVGAVPQLF